MYQKLEFSNLEIGKSNAESESQIFLDNATMIQRTCPKAIS